MLEALQQGLLVISFGDLPGWRRVLCCAFVVNLLQNPCEDLLVGESMVHGHHTGLSVVKQQRIPEAPAQSTVSCAIRQSCSKLDPVRSDWKVSRDVDGTSLLGNLFQETLDILMFVAP